MTSDYIDNFDEEHAVPLHIISLFKKETPKHLKSLKLQNMNIEPDPNYNIGRSKFAVTQVHFRDCDFEEGPRSLLRIMDQFTGVEELKIDGWRSNNNLDRNLSTRGPGVYETLLQKYPTVRNLFIDSFRFTDANVLDISRALVHFDSLESLALRLGDDIGMESMNMLITILHNNRNLRKLKLVTFRPNRTQPLLGRAAMADLLRANGGLTHLDLGYSSEDVDDDTVVVICDGLQENRTLKSLVLPALSPVGLVAVGDALSLQDNTLEMPEVRLEDNADNASLRSFFECVGRSRGLRSLTCPSIFLDVDKAKLCLTMIESNPTLEELRLRRGHEESGVAIFMLRTKIDVQLMINRFRRSLTNFPFPLWPLILGRMAKLDESCNDFRARTVERSARYHFLRQVIGKLGRESSKKSKQKSSDRARVIQVATVSKHQHSPLYHDDNKKRKYDDEPVE